MKYCLSLIVCLLASVAIKAQIIIIIPGAASFIPEHGFLPGKAFKFYPTLNKFDFNGKKLRVEIFDERDSLHLEHIACSEVSLTNSSEFKGAKGATKAAEYFDTLFKQSNIMIDSSAADTLRVHLQALDNRLIGFGSITGHGLCQMQVEYKNTAKDYCEDITDKSPHSPIGRNAFITRKTATRVIQSASLREIIEQLLVDLKALL